MGFNAKRILQSRNPWFPIEATGGTTSLLISSNPTGNSIPYRIHTFSATGVNTFTVNRPGTFPFVEYLIVGGGGSGGWGGNNSANQLRGGGGGGAGGVITNVDTEGFRVNQTSYYVNVGAGGKPKTSPATAVDLTSTSGSRSTIFGLTAEGGGAGGGRVGFSTTSPFTQYHGKAGGSGGGAGANNNATATSFPSGGSSTFNQGFSGGSTAGWPISNANITGLGTSNPSQGGAGGGGYSQRGIRNIYNSTLFYGGSGGNGLFTRIRVLSGEWIAGGGGGGAGTSSISYSLLSARGIQGQGSLGAGGFCFTNSFSGQDGVLIGSGGGGQAGISLSLTPAVAEANKPGSGGPGIVIVRYPLLSRSFVPMSVTATGSVTTTDTTINGVLYRIHTYTGDGNFIVNNINDSKGLIRYFMIGGGGSGGWGDTTGYAGAGGGAGGYITNEATTNLVVGVNNYPIIVGNGGSFLNATGGNTIAFNLTALGGGLGSNNFNPAQTGGSGGGGGMAGSLYPNPGLGTATQGFNGGFGEFGAAGGGGGATSTGISYVGGYLAGDGGSGYTCYLRNTTGEIFGGGGGGGTIAPDNNFIGIGGSSIGGNGGSGIASATNPVPNTGSGGGGGGPLAGNNFGTNGAAGITIIRYPLVYTADVLEL